MRRAAASALGRVAQADKSLAPQILQPLLAALKERNRNVSSAAAFVLGQVAQADKSLASPTLQPLLNTLKDKQNDPDGEVRNAAAFALGQIAQVEFQAKEMVFRLLTSDTDDGYSSHLGLVISLPDLFVADAETEAKNGRDPLQFLFAHLEGRQSYLPNGNANTYAVYRNLLVTAMAKWLVSDKPEAKATQAALRQRLEQMRASDRRLHLRIAAWNALAQAAELKAKEE